jgi:hypothetical protein
VPTNTPTLFGAGYPHAASDIAHSAKTRGFGISAPPLYNGQWHILTLLYGIEVTPKALGFNAADGRLSPIRQQARGMTVRQQLR